MTDSDLRRVLARRTAGRVGLVPLKDVAAGAQAVSTRLEQLARDGRSAAIVDAVFDHDLKRWAQRQRLPLSTGASGLGLGLARAMVAAGRVIRSTGTDAIAAGIGGAAASSPSSCSAATLEQIAVAQQGMPVLRLSAERLVTHADDEVSAALGWARERLAAGPVLIAASADPQAVAEVQARFGRTVAGLAVEHGHFRGAGRTGVRRLVVAGGDLRGERRPAEDPGLPRGAGDRPGVPLLRTEGQPGEAMLLALKSGNFGGPDFFAKALGMMGARDDGRPLSPIR